MQQAITDTLIITLFTALIVNGLLTLLDKFNALETMQGKTKSKFISDMFECYFCLGHHLSLLVVVPVFFIDMNWVLLFVPLSVGGLITLVK